MVTKSSSLLCREILSSNVIAGNKLYVYVYELPMHVTQGSVGLSKSWNSSFDFSDPEKSWNWTLVLKSDENVSCCPGQPSRWLGRFCYVIHLKLNTCIFFVECRLQIIDYMSMCDLAALVVWRHSQGFRMLVRTSVFSLVNSAVNMALPTFAALRRAAASCAAPLLLGARRCRSVSPVRTELSSKPAARRCCGQLLGQTDGRTPDRCMDPACSAYFVSGDNNVLCNDT